MLVLEKCNTKTKGNNNTKIFHEIYNCLIDLIYIKCFCLPPVGKFMSPVFSHLCKLSLYNPFYNYILGTFCRIYRIVIRVCRHICQTCCFRHTLRTYICQIFCRVVIFHHIYHIHTCRIRTCRCIEDIGTR